MSHNGQYHVKVHSCHYTKGKITKQQISLRKGNDFLLFGATTSLNDQYSINLAFLMCLDSFLEEGMIDNCLIGSYIILIKELDR